MMVNRNQWTSIERHSSLSPRFLKTLIYFKHPADGDCTTPLQINMEHNSGGLEDDVPLQMGDFQVPVPAVDFPGCNAD